LSPAAHRLFSHLPLVDPYMFNTVQCHCVYANRIPIEWGNCLTAVAWQYAPALRSERGDKVACCCARIPGKLACISARSSDTLPSAMIELWYACSVSPGCVALLFAAVGLLWIRQICSLTSTLIDAGTRQNHSVNVGRNVHIPVRNSISMDYIENYKLDH